MKGGGLSVCCMYGHLHWQGIRRTLGVEVADEGEHGAHARLPALPAPVHVAALVVGGAEQVREGLQGALMMVWVQVWRISVDVCGWRCLGALRTLTTRPFFLKACRMAVRILPMSCAVSSCHNRVGSNVYT